MQCLLGIDKSSNKSVSVRSRVARVALPPQRSLVRLCYFLQTNRRKNRFFQLKSTTSKPGRAGQGLMWCTGEDLNFHDRNDH